MSDRLYGSLTLDEAEKRYEGYVVESALIARIRELEACEPTAVVLPVDMGFGKFAVGTCQQQETGVPGIIYLRLPESREHGTDCGDLFPVGSPAKEQDVAAVIHFHTPEALRQSLDVLLELQEPAGMLLTADEMEFIAARVRRLCDQFAYPIPCKDDRFIVGVAGSLIGGILSKLEMEKSAVPDIKALVDRFLVWPLPATVASDMCVTMSDDLYAHNRYRAGTNLLTATEAEAMFRHALGVQPEPEGK
jgi:hypothetical protein